jgi:hypothetical protein
MAVLKRERATGQVCQPQSDFDAADLAFGSRSVGEQPIMPEPGGSRVMLAPALNALHFEAIAGDVRYRHAEVINLSPRKDISSEREMFRPEALATSIIAWRVAHNSVVKIKSARPEEPVDRKPCT